MCRVRINQFSSPNSDSTYVLLLSFGYVRVQVTHVKSSYGRRLHYFIPVHHSSRILAADLLSIMSKEAARERDPARRHGRSAMRTRSHCGIRGGPRPGAHAPSRTTRSRRVKAGVRVRLGYVLSAGCARTRKRCGCVCVRAERKPRGMDGTHVLAPPDTAVRVAIKSERHFVCTVYVNRGYTREREYGAKSWRTCRDCSFFSLHVPSGAARRADDDLTRANNAAVRPGIRGATRR